APRSGLGTIRRRLAALRRRRGAAALALAAQARWPASAAAERWCARGPVVLGLPSGGHCDGAVVWLHGEGEDPEDWAQELMAARRGARWKIVLLRAPLARVAASGARRQVWASSPSSLGGGGCYDAAARSVRRCLGELEAFDQAGKSAVEPNAVAEVAVAPPAAGSTRG
ncbi:unnamed protein product, partial [Prorocentrum cordatum]